MRMSNILLAALAVGLMQCTPSRVDRRDRPAPPSESDGTDTDRPVVSEIPLVQLPANGSQMRFLDAFALTDIYSRVFIKGGNGRWKGCGNEDQWCQKSMFSKDEAKFLGTFSLVDGVDSFRVKKDFTLNYTRNLRALLYRECKNLVDVEWPRTSNPETLKLNSLVFRQSTPEAADLDRFSRKLFGLDGTDIPLDSMVEEYRAAFASAVAAKKDADSLKSGFVVVCMALAMDPAVFLY